MNPFSIHKNKNRTATSGSNFKICSNGHILGTYADETGHETGKIELVMHKKDDVPHWLIVNFDVHPNFRQKGIGRTLLTSSFPYIKSGGGSIICVEPIPTDSAIDMETLCTIYNHLGFRPATDEENEYLHELSYQKHVLMVLCLDEHK